MIDELEASFKGQYGEEVTFNRDSNEACSIRLTYLPNHDLKLDADSYIQKSLHKCGMDPPSHPRYTAFLQNPWTAHSSPRHGSTTFKWWPAASSSYI